MPTTRATDHRIRSGVQVVTDVTGTYSVTARSKASDQPTDPNFWIIDAQQSTPPKPARVVTMADLSQAADGYYTWQWVISYMTHGMLSAWYTDFLPSGARSGVVTVRTYTDADVSVYLTAVIYRPNLPGDGAPILGGWSNVVWRFDKGVVIT